MRFPPSPLVWLATALAGLEPSPAAQGHAAASAGPLDERTYEPPTLGSSLRLAAFEGTVLLADGQPAEGALVRSSAGGRARAGIDGRFQLVTWVARDAERVQLAVEGDGVSTATATAPVPGPTDFTTVLTEPLTLGPGSPFGPRWLPTFGKEPGTNNLVRAFVVFDDGGGEALYAGGYFTTAAGQPVNRVVRWDGSDWSSLDEDPGGSVEALAVYDDGSGPALYAGLSTLIVGGPPAHWVVRWDGAHWTPLGAGVDGSVESMLVHDDGSGPALFVVGHFNSAGGGPSRGIARWDGTSWSALGAGVNSAVYALATYDDGSGPALYAGGFFTTAGGQPASRVAKWDGATWTPLAAGRDSYVTSLAVHDDGSGPALYAGGGFAGHVARWNGTSWVRPHAGLNSEVDSLEVYDDGSGPELYASGLFTASGARPMRGMARWDGRRWLPVGTGTDSAANDMAVYDDGDGPHLFVGCRKDAGGVSVDHVARWDGTDWSALVVPPKGLNERVLALAAFDDGTGTSLYAGGVASFPQGTSERYLGRLDGTHWTVPGGGVDRPVTALLVHDDGSGPALYVGGGLQQAGALAVSRIARWDGLAWSSLDGGLDFFSVTSLAAFDDGGGPRLFAGGERSSSGAFGRIARWDGAHWSPLGAGTDDDVRALAVFDDGSGPALYVGGEFLTAGGQPAARIARWDGSSWSVLGTGCNAPVRSLAVFDDGSGAALHVGGDFTVAGGVPANGIARWDGSSWSAVGGGTNGPVKSLLVHDDGGGPALFAGGAFTAAGGMAAPGLARWDGTSWTPLGSGVHPLTYTSTPASVDVLFTFDLGEGPALIAGGLFSSTPDSGDSYLARWGHGDLCLDFETEDDFATPLVNGQDIAWPGEFGRLLSITGTGPNAGAAIFDSTPGGPNDPSQDIDLLVDSGNLLILQTDQNTTQTVPGVFDRPNDDSDGGTLTFAFTSPVHPRSLALVDIDQGSGERTVVVQLDSAGRRRTHLVPPEWTGDVTLGGIGRATLDLGSLEPQPGHGATATATEEPGFQDAAVVRIEVHLGASGAVDDLCWGPGE